MPWPGDLSNLVRRDEPLSRHTSFRIGGPAEFFAEPESEGELAELLDAARQESLDVRILGAGTNLLVRDEGVRGLVLATGRLASPPRLIGQGRLLCQGGVKLAEVVRTGVEKGLAGVEALAGIPGTVGGAVACNAGTKLGATADFLARIRYIDLSGVKHEAGRKELSFGYRSGPEIDGVITWVEFAFPEGEPQDAGRRVASALKTRRETQPVSEASAGCVFKNPPGESAGRLIDAAGLKGLRIGGAEVSRKHANYIINTGGAAAAEVFSLIEHVRGKVETAFGVSLELEIEIWPEVSEGGLKL